MTDAHFLILDTIFETLPSGLLMCALDGRIIRINYKAKEILGLEATYPYTHINQFPDTLTPFGHRLLMEDEDVHRGEVALRLPAREEESTIGYSLKHIEGEDGQRIKTVTFSDITQVLKDRLAMDKIKDELNQSRKLASIGTMIAGVAHELNNPLTGISMSTSLIKMNLERLKKQPDVAENARLAESLDKALDEVAKIGRSSEKAAVLVSDLLAYSKPSQLELVPLCLNELVSDIVNALRSHPQFSQFGFEIEPAEPTTVLCDRVRMEQVFYNLFKNACDATEGKGAIVLSFEPVTEEGTPFVITRVRDNGPGIDTAIITRIFDPFFTTKGHGGVGLGLSVSYRTVEQHGGLLSVTSTPGEGTEFQVKLPIYLEGSDREGRA